jgi:hypothetical protein
MRTVCSSSPLYDRSAPESAKIVTWLSLPTFARTDWQDEIRLEMEDMKGFKPWEFLSHLSVCVLFVRTLAVSEYSPFRLSSLVKLMASCKKVLVWEPYYSLSLSSNISRFTNLEGLSCGHKNQLVLSIQKPPTTSYPLTQFWILVSWYMTPCTLVNMSQGFGEIRCVHLQGRRVAIWWRVSILNIMMKSVWNTVLLSMEVTPH